MPSAVMDLPPAISEPVQLTSATLRGINVGASTSRTTLQASPASSSRAYGHSGVAAMGIVVRVSQSGTTLKRSKAHAVFVSQGEGVVIVDPSTQRALQSYTLPSSHQPITPPLVVFDSTHQTTFVCAWPRTQGDTAELHSWTETISKRSTGGLEEQAVHHVAEVHIDTASLHPFSATQLLAQGRDGSLSIIDFGSLQEPRPRQMGSERFGVDGDASSGKGRHIVHTTVLDRMASASILRSYPTRPSGALILTLISDAVGLAEMKTRSGRKARKSAIEVIDAAEAPKRETVRLADVRLNATTAETDGEMRRLGGVSNLASALGFASGSEVLSATLHHSGRFAVLLRTGELVTAHLEISADGTPGLSDVSRLSLQLHATAEGQTSNVGDLAIVSPSTIFLATQSSASPSHACALLIDIELGAVLAETEWRTSAGGVGALHAHRIGGSTMLLLASPSAELAGTRGDALYLYAMPYEAGDGNHLRWALASRHLTAKWIATTKGQASASGAGSDESLQSALLTELSLLSGEGNGDAMDAAFEKWLASQPRRFAKKGQQGTKLIRIPQAFAESIAALSIPPPRALEKQDAGAKGKRVYARKCVHALLQHKVLQSAFVPERRLLEALWNANDMDAVMLALRNVDDLVESDIVSVLVRSRQSEPARKGAAPSLAFRQVLAIVTDLPITRTPFRQAMKTLIDDKILAAMLETLSAWLDKAATGSVLKEDKQRKAPKATTAEDVPSLQGCLALAIDVLDTFFPTLLTDVSLHAHLSRLAAQVQAHLVALNRLQILHAPLAAFAQLEDDIKREAEVAAAAKKQQRLIDADASDDERDAQLMNLRVASKGDKTGARGGDQATSHIGGGSMSKYGLPDKSRRLKLKEESLSVGLYQLEQLEL